MAEIGASSYRRFLARQGDVGVLVQTYSDALVRFAYSYVRSAEVAEDLAADALATIIFQGKSFPDEGHLRSYLFKILRNKAMDYLRHHRDTVPLEDLENILGGGDPQGDLLRKERNGAVYRCLQKLPEQYRLVLQLAYLEGFSVPEVCTVLRKTPKQIYNLLSRAKSVLKTELEKEGITREDL